MVGFLFLGDRKTLVSSSSCAQYDNYYDHAGTEEGENK